MLTQSDVTLRSILLIAEIARFEGKSTSRTIKRATKLFRASLGKADRELLERLEKMNDYQIIDVIRRSDLWGRDAQGNYNFKEVNVVEQGARSLMR